ncbi:hypothetical protein FHS83_000857 [Rhizomicrobium palustre]|uniref:Histidine kinase n=1 Tax=Rhizomicrobium palustre TaxID=189966 RepID=A0A846MWD6_9PROT|nr:ATP-binding protein [Rhizomicrobium palustre]NIK87539.1 hypothetical protein [Rhizomicrobium palustre]
MTTEKREVALIDGTPDKRMFWSIMSDYDLKTALCELVDNAIDIWRQGSKRKQLVVSVVLDVARQLIYVSDNAGGVGVEDLRFLLAPGGSKNDPHAEIVGIFGVGSKRASIALGERVEITTHHRGENTHQIEIDKAWLGHDDWHLRGYEVPDIPSGTTRVHISHLRKPFIQHDLEEIAIHLGQTYCRFIGDGCLILLNEAPVQAISFENWSYPPNQVPRRAVFASRFGDDGVIQVDITGGLIVDRNPEEDNYGVYFYCNDRLIVKELKSREVGYLNSLEAGVPHWDISLSRVIVRLTGPAILMPWNSSKNGINFSHPAFQRVRPTVVQLTSYFSKLSRRLKDDWDGNVFRHKSGSMEIMRPEDVDAGHFLHMPDLPKRNKSRAEKLKLRNKKVLGDHPWTLGLVEAMAAVELVSRQTYATKNRLALIILDSNFEIALKEFIVHRDDLFPAREYTDSRIAGIFRSRTEVMNTVQAKLPIKIPDTLIGKAKHYYLMRNKLIHERATLDVLDADIVNYRKTIEKVLAHLYGLKF